MLRPLIAFCFVACQNDREFWYRVHTIRERGPSGEFDTRTSDLSPELARRVADRLCDRFGITDRGALMCGRIFHRQNGTWN